MSNGEFHRIFEFGANFCCLDLQPLPLLFFFGRCRLDAFCPSSYCLGASLATTRWSLPPQLVTAEWRSTTLWGPLSRLARKSQLTDYPFESGHAQVVCHISVGQFFFASPFFSVFFRFCCFRVKLKYYCHLPFASKKTA